MPPDRVEVVVAGGRQGPKVRGVALLEVVLALAILVSALAGIGLAIHNSERAAQKAVESARALMLAELVILNFDTTPLRDESEASGGFGVQGHENWAWSFRKATDPNVEGLERVELRIVEGDPEGLEDEQRLILRTQFLRAAKRNLNLVEDLGLSTGQVEKITEMIPGGEALFDPADFDPSSLARLDMDTLTQVLPQLMQAFMSAGLTQAMAAGAGGGGMGGLPRGASPQQLLDAAGVDPGQLGDLGGTGGLPRMGRGGGRRGGAGGDAPPDSFDGQPADGTGFVGDDGAAEGRPGRRGGGRRGGADSQGGSADGATADDADGSGTPDSDEPQPRRGGGRRGGGGGRGGGRAP